MKNAAKRFSTKAREKVTVASLQDYLEATVAELRELFDGMVASDDDDDDGRADHMAEVAQVVGDRHGVLRELFREIYEALPEGADLPYELQRVSYALAHLGVIDACALAAWYEHEGYEGYFPPNSYIVGAEIGLDWLERDVRDERSRTAWL